jgi:hypothetical protein
VPSRTQVKSSSKPPTCRTEPQQAAKRRHNDHRERHHREAKIRGLDKQDCATNTAGTQTHHRNSEVSQIAASEIARGHPKSPQKERKLREERTMQRKTEAETQRRKTRQRERQGRDERRDRGRDRDKDCACACARFETITQRTHPSQRHVVPSPSEPRDWKTLPLTCKRKEQ